LERGAKSRRYLVLRKRGKKRGAPSLLRKKKGDGTRFSRDKKRIISKKKKGGITGLVLLYSKNCVGCGGVSFSGRNKKSEVLIVPRVKKRERGTIPGEKWNKKEKGSIKKDGATISEAKIRYVKKRIIISPREHREERSPRMKKLGREQFTWKGKGRRSLERKQALRVNNKKGRRNPQSKKKAALFDRGKERQRAPTTSREGDLSSHT